METELPPGERIVRCLTGGDIDRVPFGVNLGWFPWGVFGTCRDFMGAEELLVGFYSEPEMIRDMMTLNSRSGILPLSCITRLEAASTIDFK